MNDFELETKLKSVPLPERSAEYWENFPAHVRWQSHRAAPTSAVQKNGWLPFAWKMTAGFACLVLSLLVLSQPLQATAGALFKNEQRVRQQLAELPGHLRVFMADEHGLHYLVAEKE